MLRLCWDPAESVNFSKVVEYINYEVDTRFTSNFAENVQSQTELKGRRSSPESGPEFTPSALYYLAGLKSDRIQYYLFKMQQ